METHTVNKELNRIEKRTIDRGLCSSPYRSGLACDPHGAWGPHAPRWSSRLYRVCKSDSLSSDPGRLV